MENTQLISLKDDENDLILQDGNYIIQVRNIDHILKRVSFMQRGWGNGYVGLPAGHLWYGVNYDDIPVDVHGGLTFGEEIELYGNKYWVIGFDTAHYDDSLSAWPKSRVMSETMDLLEQCKSAIKQLA